MIPCIHALHPARAIACLALHARLAMFNFAPAT